MSHCLTKKQLNPSIWIGNFGGQGIEASAAPLTEAKIHPIIFKMKVTQSFISSMQLK